MKHITKAFKYFIVNFEAVVGAIILTLIFVDVVLQVMTRLLPGNAIGWTVELGQILLGTLIWIGIGEGVRQKAHVSFDMLVQSMPLNWKKIFQVLADIIFILFLLLMSMLTMVLLRDYINFGSRTTVLRLQLYWVRLPIVVGCILGSIRLVIHIVLILQNKEIPFDRNDQEFEGAV